jgi:glyoxylase-like metal-dependent hydrolase (beta-lactamase superfamily II)
MSLEDDFCDIIKKARIGLGLSIGEVADKSGIRPDTVTVLERAGRQQTRAEVTALAAVLGLRTEPLVQIALDGWQPADPPALACVETVLGDIGGYQVKGYVLYDAGEAVFIDTAYNPESMLEVVSRKNLTLKAVCLTHGHSDHAEGVDVILQHLQVPVYIGREDVKLLSWKPPQKLMAPCEEGRTMTVGSLTVTCMATPGHTPGGICYRVQRGERELCFVGDTLFAGSIGRANPATLYPAHLRSVRTKVLTQPAQMVLLPGHGPATTVAEELLHNPFMVSL